ncbi:MAG: Glycosyltransferase (Modular protein) [Parcubacteria group bacterium GW2011_GWA2_43_13]|nr:MAG: Glycosyltransferase (Modular protein) [Parcubacteria group bacterium GW2011_GWA2_43_13]OGY71446.1 MAG: hypothetical protein A2986_03830 [Candidatus Jacksonbacteria bacterium RIFCSPLOWO2_01_FULL_44_13]HAZ16640.1 hypothetical protein [Candidatus Jacksonbacteria bacterium]
MAGLSAPVYGGNMKIAIITTTFPPIVGGMAVASYYHATLLAQHGVEVHVFTQTIDQKSEDANYPFTVHRLTPRVRFGYSAYAPQLKKILKEYSALLIEYPAYGLAEPAYQAAQSYNIPLFVYYHMDTIADGIKGAVFFLYRKIMFPRILKQARGVLVASDAYARHSYLSNHKTLLANRLSVIPLGVDTRRFYPGGGNSDILQLLDIKRSDTLIGFVGALDSQHYFKGIPVLLRALACLIRKYPLPSFQCIIVGDGNMRSEYEKLSRDLGVSQYVIFAGKVSHTDLPRYFQLFDMFILPSTDQSEAFGLVVLEAMASAKPVIVSDLPGPRSLVDHESDGFIFSSGDDQALASYVYELLNDTHKRSSMGARGREKVARTYQWPIIGAQLYEYIRTHI